jgi:hypothetical protein
MSQALTACSDLHKRDTAQSGFPCRHGLELPRVDQMDGATWNKCGTQRLVHGASMLTMGLAVTAAWLLMAPTYTSRLPSVPWPGDRTAHPPEVSLSVLPN